MRTDIKRKIQGCLSQAVQMTMKTKRAPELAPFDPGIRFSTVVVDILGPVKMATSTKAKYVLVLTDLFTMYTVAVSPVSMDSADVAREIVENWVTKFGAPNGVHTDQRKSFSDKLIHEMCRLSGIDKTQTSPYKPKGNGKTGEHNSKIAHVILKYCAENPRTWDSALPYMYFVYNTTINRISGATPFSMLHGEE